MFRSVSHYALVVALLSPAAAIAQEVPASPAPKAEDTELEAVIVTGLRGSANNAIALERDSDALITAISGDDVGNFADQNVAESLRRAAGLDVTRSEGEGRNVSVRGLPSSFTAVTVNGARIGSVDSDGAAVQLDSVASELLDGIIVQKAATADMDGDNIGGSVDMKALSAFSRRGDLLSLQAEGYYNQISNSWGPKGSISLTRKLLDGTLGVATTFTYSERTVQGDDLLNSEGFNPRAGVDFVLPGRVDHRLELGTRQRFGGTVNLEFRPTDDHEAFLRVQYTQLSDDDGRWGNRYETSSFSGTPVSTSALSGVLDRSQIRKQIQLQEYKDKVFAGSAGTKHRFGDWTLSWQADYSRAWSDLPIGYRGRFRLQNVPLEVTLAEDVVQVRPRVAGTVDPNNPALYAFDQLLFFGYTRNDELYSIKADVERQFEMFGREASFKVGFKHRTRDKSNDRFQTSVNPQSSAFNNVPGIAALRGNLSTLTLFRPESQIDDLGFFPDRESARARFAAVTDAVRGIARRQALDDFGQDYVLGERTYAGYAMATAQVTDTVKVIGGVRIEHSRMFTTGFYIEHDDEQNGPTPGNFGRISTTVPGLVVPLTESGREDTFFLPNLHVRWQPSQDIDVRASYTKGLQRPDFGDFVNSLRFDFQDSAVTQTGPTATPIRGSLSGGNPNLKPLTADQFDLSVGWYPNRDSAFSVAVFYKRIKDFFVDFDGEFTSLPAGIISLPTAAQGRVHTPRLVETTLNGGVAEVLGVEIAASQNFTFLPGLLSGLFLQGNITLVDSKARADFIRPGETFRFPGQADIVANLSIGWENDTFSLRFAGNYRGDALSSISGASSNAAVATNDRFFEDVFQASYKSLDINLRVNITDNLSFYADAVNVTKSADELFYRGFDRTGPIFQRVEQFGRTFNIGVRAKF
jgi:iron complex outermembrane recepter protein